MKKAFTLIELLTVVSVIGILAVIATVAFMNVKRNTTDKTIEANLTTLNNAVTRARNSGIAAEGLTYGTFFSNNPSSPKYKGIALNALTANWSSNSWIGLDSAARIKLDPLLFVKGLWLRGEDVWLNASSYDSVWGSLTDSDIANFLDRGYHIGTGNSTGMLYTGGGLTFQKTQTGREGVWQELPARYNPHPTSLDLPSSVTSSGTARAELIVAEGGFRNKITFGVYQNNPDGSRTLYPLVTEGTQNIATTTIGTGSWVPGRYVFNIPALSGGNIGFYMMAPRDFSNNPARGIYYSMDPSDSSDGLQHFILRHNSKTRQITLAAEDYYGGGDRDFQDFTLVITY